MTREERGCRVDWEQVRLTEERLPEGRGVLGQEQKTAGSMKIVVPEELHIRFSMKWPK